MTDAPYKINQVEALAVAEGYYWQPMDTCPTGVKVQLLGQGGVPQYAIWDGRNKFWVGWAPLPRRSKERLIEHKELLRPC